MKKNNLKQGYLGRKIGSLLLAVAMVIASFPACSPEVHAEGTLEPGQFATKEQLKGFNTDDTDDAGKNPAKLCLGNNNQEWWIVGSQSDDSLTLFATSPLARQSFEDDYESDKPYSADWGCNYPGEAPSEVYPNHYGASPLRTTLKGLETSYFSTAEQNLMKNTTIYTKDTKKDSVYSTTDKLYLANSVSDQSKYITVGANASDDLNNGLRIDPAYWINSMHWSCDGFWLRTPHMNMDYREVVLLADTDHVSNCVVEGNVTGLVPAFELNLSTVLFASAAKAASSDDAEAGTIADGAAMALRLNDAGKAIGTLKYDEAAGLISARKDENAEGVVSLVVQGNDGDKEWYYSVPAGVATAVTKKQIQDACNVSAEIDFGKCKIWLEATKDRIAYARMAEAPTNPPTERPTNLPTKKPTNSPTKTPGITHLDEVVHPEEVKKNSVKLDSGISVKWKGNALALKWPKIAGAGGYDIFAAESGKKRNKKSMVKTVKNGKTSVSITKTIGKKISAKKVYYVKIQAWKYVGGKKAYIGSSRIYYIVGKKNKRYTNAKKLKLAKKKYAMKKGRSVRIKVTIVKQSKKKKLLPKSYGPALQYRTGNVKIATVTQKGRIKARKKGNCYIYVTALNGVGTKIKVTVK